ncbi:MAG: polysaccharide deacetylase family protein [Bacillota bacterium]|nr:polysaccharide deacetylase family protein [Bacillota bacterium]
MKRQWCFIFILMMLLSLTACSNTVVTQTSPQSGLLIIMYHQMLKAQESQGDYVISPDEFEQDLKFLKENGYHTITCRQLVAYKEGKFQMPSKPVMLTFDDGYITFNVYAAPILKKYGMRAVVSVVGKYVDTYTENGDRNASYAYLTWDDINHLSNDGVADFENHTYDMHSISGRIGASRKYGENESDYIRTLSEDLTHMQQKLEECTGSKPVCFTYPFGSACRESFQTIKNLGFKMSFSCEEGMNALNEDSSIYCLKRFNRRHGRSVESIVQSLNLQNGK